MAQGRPLLPDDTATMVVSHDVWKNKFEPIPTWWVPPFALRGHAFEVVGNANPAFGAGELSRAASGSPSSMEDAVRG